MTKKQFEKTTGYTIKYLDISANSRDTSSTMELSNGKTYHGEHFGGGYTQAQAKDELFNQVLEQLREDNFGKFTIEDFTKFIALDIIMLIAEGTQESNIKLIKDLAKKYNATDKGIAWKLLNYAIYWNTQGLAKNKETKKFLKNYYF